MVANLDELQRLVDEVAGFAIRDRGLLREQDEMRKALLEAQQAGIGPPAHHITRYTAAVRRYFVAFHSEATKHLDKIDRRLEHLAQLQANAIAERGVAARRAEITQKVVAHLERV